MNAPGTTSASALRRCGHARLGFQEHLCRTVMQLEGTDVRVVSEYDLAADDKHPYVVEKFAPPRVLD